MFGYSGQIGHGFGELDELFQGGHDFFAGKQPAEEIDFVAEFFVGNGLDEFFGGGAGYGVEFCDLSGGSEGDLAGFAFRGELRDETDSLGSCGVDAPAGEQQIADERVPEIALQAGYAAESWDESEAKLGEGEARHFVGDDDVAGEREFQAAAETDSMDRGDGHEGRGVDGVQDRVDAFEELPDAREALLGGKGCGASYSSRKSAPAEKPCLRALVMMHAEVSGASEGNAADELLEFGEHGGTDFVGGLAIEGQFEDGVAQVPAQRFAREGSHFREIQWAPGEEEADQAYYSPEGPR